jgi:hypothetical protein
MKNLKIVFFSLCLSVIACKSEPSNNNQSANNSSSETTATAPIDATYTQAAGEACACLQGLGDVNRRRAAFMEKARFDSASTVSGEERRAAFDSLRLMAANQLAIKKVALESWKCFEAKIGALGALDSVKLNAALAVLCPTWKNFKSDGIDVAPVH